MPFPGTPPPGPPGGRTLLGEVIGASYGAFTAESYNLHETPPLGGLVVVEHVLGLVYEARTEGLGPISAKGAAAATPTAMSTTSTPT